MSEVEDVLHSMVVDVKDWVLPDPKLMVSKLNGEISMERKQIWIVDDSLSPYTLYSYLHARFGKPNGFAMTLKHPSSDNLIQWHYTLTCRDKVIDIYGKNTQMEFIVESEGEICAEDWTAMVANIKGDMRNYAQELKQIRSQLEKYILFVNPYKRVKTIVDKFATRLAALNVHEISLPENPRTREELETLSERFNKAVETYTEAAALSTSLKMIAPVMAESFVNMLIFILQKEELKEDERLYQSVIRSQIDIKVKGLGLYCKEFVKKVDTDREEFKNFHSLMNERNNILHGNVDPMKFSLGEVFFDDNTFVGKEQQSFSERALKNVLRYVEPESALEDVKVVREFINFILEHIEPSLIDPIKMVLDCDNPGWHENNKHISVLFPQHVAESFIGLV